MKDLLIIFVVLLILLLLISSFGGSIKFNDVHKPIPVPYATKEEKEKFIADIPGIKNMSPKHMLNNISRNNQKNVTFSETLETFSVADSAKKYMARVATSEDAKTLEHYDNISDMPNYYSSDSISYSEENAINNLGTVENFDVYNINNDNDKNDTKVLDISPYDGLHQEYAALD